MIKNNKRGFSVDSKLILLSYDMFNYVVIVNGEVYRDGNLERLETLEDYRSASAVACSRASRRGGRGGNT